MVFVSITGTRFYYSRDSEVCFTFKQRHIKTVDDEDSLITKGDTKLAVRIFKYSLTESNIPHTEKVLLRRSKQENSLKFLNKEFLKTSFRFALMWLTTHTLRK